MKRCTSQMVEPAIAIVIDLDDYPTKLEHRAYRIRRRDIGFCRVRISVAEIDHVALP